MTDTKTDAELAASMAAGAAEAERVAAAMYNGLSLADSIQQKVSAIREAHRRAASKSEPVLKMAWDLTEAEANRAKHKDSLEKLEVEVCREREYLAYWEAKYADARRRLALVTYHSGETPPAQA